MKIKFITLNIWQGELLDEAIKFLQKEEADVVALQEVFNGHDESLSAGRRSLEILKEKLGYSYFNYAPALLSVYDKNIEQGNAVFSKFPIKETNVTFYDIPFGPWEEVREKFPFCPRNLQHVSIELDEKNCLNIFNTQGIWGEDGNDNERRLAMSRKIVEQTHGKENVILAGDFNLNPNTLSAKLIENELVNVFGETLSSTFNMKHKTNPGYATAAVDMIFVSKNFEVFDKRCYRDDVSDHLALSVVVGI